MMDDVLVFGRNTTKGRGWQRSQTSHVINGDEKTWHANSFG